MSRCKCCDAPLTSNASESSPGWNRVGKQEEDLCSVCRYLVYNSYPVKEYVGGRYPTNGLTNPVQVKDS
jgi:hypothetical protein